MTRFDNILALGPVRFYVSPEQYFGGSLALLGDSTVNSAEKLVRSSSSFRAIPNCKPGIWTSRTRKINENHAINMECIVYWVADGEINMGQSVTDWKKYEEETRDRDGAVKLSQIVPKDTKWRKRSTYFDDGGICNIISTVYLTEKTARRITVGEDEGEENFSYEGYIAALTLGYQDIEFLIPHERNKNCTLGGMSFNQDAVGGPPNIALAEDGNGQVIALRMYNAKIPEGEDEPPAEGPEDGFTSADDEESEMTSQQIRAKKESEILSLRHSLQRMFLSREHEPREEDMGLMSEYIAQLEVDTDLEAGTIRITKINKVLKAILKLDNIPKEDEFNFRPRLQALLDRWNVLLEGY
ncbi:hypothetical protein F5884DRAFT_753609 [Xylogone sp. PMI_703]|nr:hypothetical protein F5884DRAFT_753609 [Xylogone sp. PMI_703]